MWGSTVYSNTLYTPVLATNHQTNQVQPNLIKYRSVASLFTGTDSIVPCTANVCTLCMYGHMYIYL